MSCLHSQQARRMILSCLIAAGPLAACSASYDRVATSSIQDDYHKRHPIVLAKAPHRLDVFLVGASRRLDTRQARDIAAFAADYKAEGQGPLSAMLPILPDRAAVKATFDDIRAQLARSGVRGSILVGHYPVADPRIASAIQLSFLKVEAKVPTKCGQWPSDLASGSSTEGWSNRTYYNFGCATQKDFAMQVADPRDLVRARPEDPSDVNMRLHAVGNLEEGLDPGTAWLTNNTSISPVGAQ